MQKLILFFALLPLTVTAQDDSSPTSKQKKFAIGIIGSADRCFRILTSHDNDGKAIMEIREDERPIFGYTAGAHFNWMFHQRMAIEGGVLYAQKGYKIPPYNVIWVVTPQGVTLQDPALPSKIGFTYHFTYMDIPLKFRYDFTMKKKLKFYGAAGISTNVLLQETTVVNKEYQDGRTEKTKSNDSGYGYYKRLNFAALLGIGLRYDLPNSFIKLEPIYRCSFITLVDAPIHGYLTQAGVELGYYFRF